MILRRDFLKSALAVGFAAGSHSQLWASSNAPQTAMSRRSAGFLITRKSSRLKT